MLEMGELKDNTIEGFFEFVKNFVEKDVRSISLEEESGVISFYVKGNEGLLAVGQLKGNKYWMRRTDEQYRWFFMTR